MRKILLAAFLFGLSGCGYSPGNTYNVRFSTIYFEEPAFTKAVEHVKAGEKPPDTATPGMKMSEFVKSASSRKLIRRGTIKIISAVDGGAKVFVKSSDFEPEDDGKIGWMLDQDIYERVSK